MRVAHVTDIHVQRPPAVRELLGKRAVGAANLYLGGRKSHFTPQVQEALVEAVQAQAPDMIACTGDLTALASRSEFEAAYELLGGLFSAQPTVLVTGNHDTYTRSAWKGQHLERRFGQWMGSGPWPRVHSIGEEVAVIALDVSRAAVSSSGRIDAGQLSRLEALLSGGSLKDKTTLVMLHYPLRDRHGAPYGPPARALNGARELEAVLLPHAPGIAGILHGHEHHGFRTQISGAHGDIPIFNSGASGYAWLPEKRRTAHFCIYTLQDRAVADVQRFAFDGRQFVPEAGGAWASGG